MMNRVMLVVFALAATVGDAQGRGGRQGGPPQGPRCVDLNNIGAIQMLQGPRVVTDYGPEAANGVVILMPKAGVALADVLAPCAGASSSDPGDPFSTNLFAPSWVMSHQQAVNLTDEQKN